MDTNMKERTEQEKQAKMQEKVENYKQEQLSLLNQAKESQGNAAKQVNDSLKSISQTSQEQKEPFDLYAGLVPNSQAKADELTNIGLESQSQSQNEPYTIIPPDVSEGVKYQKYRNTGVDYFDRKGNLSLLDAYLAKQLGLNVSYNFHKIDMKVDNTSRLRQSLTGRNRYNKSAANSLKLALNTVSFGNAEWKNDRHYSARVVATGADKVFGSLTNANVPQDVLLAMLKNNTADNLSLGTPQGSSNKNKEVAEDMFKTYADTERVFAVAGELLTNNIAEMESGLVDMKVSGTHNAREIQMLENQLATTKRVQQLFRESNKENMKDNSIAIMAELAKIQKFAF